METYKIYLALDYSLLPEERFLFLYILEEFVNQQKIALKSYYQLSEKLAFTQEKLGRILKKIVAKKMVVYDENDKIFVLNIGTLSEALRYQIRLASGFKMLFSMVNVVAPKCKIKGESKKNKIDYKSWLSLLCLTIHSDQNGIVSRLGIHEFKNHTGVNKSSVVRTIDKLLSLGILRSKINGSLDNKYLSFTSPIYFLNLSHPIWGEARKYQKFGFVSLPDRSIQLRDIFFNLENIQEKLGNKFTPRKNMSLVLGAGDMYEVKEVIGLDETLSVFQEFQKLVEHTEFGKKYVADGKEIKLKKTDNKNNNLRWWKYRWLRYRNRSTEYSSRWW